MLKSKPQQNRPISLTNTIAKVMERCMRKQLINFLEKHNLLNPRQHGFRANRSCQSQLINHFEELVQDLESGYGSDTVYLDYSKAFDKVDHGLLYYKLHEIGIQGNVREWIK